jgi:hypothetical protein
MEQSRVDIAATNLAAIHSAQRAYWIEYRTYGASTTALYDADLVELEFTDAAATPFTYEISDATTSTFSAFALRTGSSVWSGQLDIDQGGTITGSITDGTSTLTPSTR